MKKLVVLLTMGLIFVVVVAQATAQGVVKTDMSSGKNVVKARKYALKVIKANRNSLGAQLAMG